MMHQLNVAAQCASRVDHAIDTMQTLLPRLGVIVRDIGLHSVAFRKSLPQAVRGAARAENRMPARQQHGDDVPADKTTCTYDQYPHPLASGCVV